jgi:hypothetical protein
VLVKAREGQEGDHFSGAHDPLFPGPIYKSPGHGHRCLGPAASGISGPSWSLLLEKVFC